MQRLGASSASVIRKNMKTALLGLFDAVNLYPWGTELCSGLPDSDTLVKNSAMQMMQADTLFATCTKHGVS